MDVQEADETDTPRKTDIEITRANNVYGDIFILYQRESCKRPAVKRYNVWLVRAARWAWSWKARQNVNELGARDLLRERSREPQ